MIEQGASEKAQVKEGCLQHMEEGTDHKNTVKVCMDETRKAKVSLELNLARDVKVNGKGLFKYMGVKRKTRESVGLILN